MSPFGDGVIRAMRRINRNVIRKQGTGSHGGAGEAVGAVVLALDSLLVILGFFVVMPMISLRFVDQLGWAGGGRASAGVAPADPAGAGHSGRLAGGQVRRTVPLIVGGMLLRAAGFASLAYAQSGLELILSCIISGLGGCLFDPPRAALVIKFTRPRQRGRYISLLMMLESAGAVVGPCSAAGCSTSTSNMSVCWGPACLSAPRCATC